MGIQPIVSDRTAQSYAAIRLKVKRDKLPDVVPRALGDVFAFLEEQQIAPCGPPLIRYLVVDYRTGNVEVEIGIPAECDTLRSNAAVCVGWLPAGSYASAMHRGPYETLVDTTAALLDWAKQSGIGWAVSEKGDVATWGARVEHYLVGPPNENDPGKWQTEAAIQLAEAKSAT